MKTLSIIIFSLVISLSSWAQQQLTVTVPSADSIKEFNCGQAEALKQSCDTEKDAAKKNALKSEQMDPSGKRQPMTCAQADTIMSRCDSSNTQACDDSYQDYRKAVAEKEAKCAAFNKCEDDGSSQFSRCKSFSESGGVSEFGDKLQQKDMLEACPYFAKDDYDSYDKKEKDLTEKVKDGEKEMREITDKMKEDQDATTKATGDLKKEIEELRGKGQQALGDLNKQVQDIQSGGLKAQGKVREQIQAVQVEIDKRRVEDVAKAMNEYNQTIMKIQEQCYKYALEMAANEAKRIRDPRGMSAKDASAQLAAGGSVEYLRQYSNKSFKDCQEQRLFSNPQTNAQMIFDAQKKAIQLDLNRLDQQMKTLRVELGRMSAELPQQMQQVQQSSYQEAQNYMQQAQTKEQELQTLMQTSQQVMMKKQQEIMALQKEQQDLQKQLASMKKKKSSASEAMTAGSQTKTDFFDALRAFHSYESAREMAASACCDPNGKLLPGVARKYNQSLCQTSSTSDSSSGRRGNKAHSE